MPKLYELAKVLRSKNSGPFEITLDVLFDDPAPYQRTLASGLITKERIAALYHLLPEHVLNVVHFDAALGIKITFLRSVPSGTVGDRDVYGAQQHAPLMNLIIP